MNQGSNPPNPVLAMRTRLGVSQKTMGTLLGVSREWVSKMENNRQEVSEFVQMKLRDLEKEPREVDSHVEEQTQNPYGSGGSVPITPPMRVNPAYALPPANPSRTDVEGYVRECLDTAEKVAGGVAWFHFALTSEGYLQKLRAKLNSEHGADG